MARIIDPPHGQIAQAGDISEFLQGDFFLEMLFDKPDSPFYSWVSWQGWPHLDQALDKCC